MKKYITEINGNIKEFTTSKEALDCFVNAIREKEKEGFTNYGYGYNAKLVKREKVIYIKTYLAE